MKGFADMSHSLIGISMFKPTKVIKDYITGRQYAVKPMQTIGCIGGFMVCSLFIWSKQKSSQFTIAVEV
jgi:hypothetical protein